MLPLKFEGLRMIYNITLLASTFTIISLLLTEGLNL